jgi:hypothetical protein
VLPRLIWLSSEPRSRRSPEGSRYPEALAVALITTQNAKRSGPPSYRLRGHLSQFAACRVASGRSAFGADRLAGGGLVGDSAWLAESLKGQAVQDLALLGGEAGEYVAGCLLDDQLALPEGAATTGGR